jgi:hypothetical protein
MNKLDKIKLFALANSLTEHQLDKIEAEHDLNLQREPKQDVQKKDYYLQFDLSFRKEAKQMSEHYEVFYCLEKSIRALISELMEEKFGENWWNQKVGEPIKNNVKANIKRDEDSGFTIRSEQCRYPDL